MYPVFRSNFFSEMVNATSVVGWEQPRLSPIQTTTAEVIEVLSAFQVLLMQAGLALLEAGKSRRNTTSFSSS